MLPLRARNWVTYISTELEYNAIWKTKNSN
jgi:hypothetical protein